jgi:hypothetical protein
MLRLVGRLHVIWPIAGLAAACASGLPAPGPTAHPRDRVEISEVAEVGPYLDATLTGEASRHRFFFPASGDCRKLLVEGGEARYGIVGPFGRLRDDEGAFCDPVGVGSLAVWRDALPRRRSRYLVPRVQAVFRPVLEEGELLLVRGRFPLTLEIRWPEPMDSVAVLPDVAPCRALLREPSATLEFHAQGAEVFVLVGTGGRCPVLGFAIPLEVR